MRTSIFHAKNGRPVLLPQDQTQRARVADAKERYTRLYLDLASDLLNARFLSGAMTAAGFRMMVGESLAQLAIAVTDDPAPAGREDREVSPARRPVLTLDTSRAPDLDASFQAAIMGKVTVSELTEVVPGVARFGGLAPDGTLVQIQSMEGALDPDGFGRLEIVLAARGVNSRLPRSTYAT